MQTMARRAPRAEPTMDSGRSRADVAQRRADGGPRGSESTTLAYGRRLHQGPAVQRVAAYQAMADRRPAEGPTVRPQEARLPEETAQLEARLHPVGDVGASADTVIQPMWPFDQLGDWLGSLVGNLLFPEIEDEEGNILHLGSHEIGNLERWGEHIISNRSGRDRPDFNDQGVFDREMAVFFRSVIAGRQTVTRVSRAQRGENENLAYVPVRWFFDDGEVRGVGFNVHVDQHGDLTPGSAWMVGVDNMAVQPQDLAGVDFNAVIQRIQGSAQGERFREQVAVAQRIQEEKARRSNDRWSRLGRRRRDTGGGSSSSK